MITLTINLMRSNVKIALSMPGSDKPDKYFSLRLKHVINNEVSEFKAVNKILVLSDIEGNFMAFLTLLVNNNVIDKKFKWTFGDGHLVIVGDCFDRGEYVAECLWLIYSLEEKARKRGGYVHFILGNHEIMNLNGDWRYVHPKYTRSSKIPYTAIYNGNNELKQWLCSKNIIEKIGDYLFVHGGIAPELLKHKISVTEINNIARPYYLKAGQKFNNPLLNLLFNSESSPFWFRGYYQDFEEKIIDATLKHFEVSTIITGHTMAEQVRDYFNKKVINVDTDHANGKSEALLILGQQLYRVNEKGKRIHFY